MADPETAAPPLVVPIADPSEEVVSVPRSSAGEALTIAGIIHLSLGTTAMAVVGAYVANPDNHCGWMGDVLLGCPINAPIATLFVGIPNIVTGVGLAAVGIPLWVTGAKKKHNGNGLAPHTSRERDDAPTPTFSLTAGGGRLTIPF
jgi:hypothetical protein